MKILTFIFCLFLSVTALAQNTVHGNTVHGNPLFIVDGVIVTNGIMNNLKPSDIEKITVLKGKVAISIYGEKAADGVIIITTKNHKVKRPLSRFAMLQHALISTPDSVRPLITIDGAIYKGDIMTIDSNKVAGIDFLKAEWATIIYGNAGANGVLNIKTKQHTVVDSLKKQ